MSKICCCLQGGSTPELWKNPRSHDVARYCVEHYRTSPTYKSMTRWNGEYLSLRGSLNVPNHILVAAFAKYEIYDDEALNRKLCLFLCNRESYPVLVFSSEGKVLAKPASALSQLESIRPNLTLGDPDLKKKIQSDHFLSLLRILSWVVKQGLGQDDSTEEIQWLKKMSDDRTIKGIPHTILRYMDTMLGVGSGKDDDFSNIQDLFSKLCGCPPLHQLGKAFQFHLQDSESLESDTVITVRERHEWDAIGGIRFQRTPAFLVVNVQCPCPEATSSLTVQLTFNNSKPVSVNYNLFAFSSLFDANNVAALKSKGAFYLLCLGGSAAEHQKKNKKTAERDYLKAKCSFLIFEQDMYEQETGLAGACPSEPESSSNRNSLPAKDSLDAASYITRKTMKRKLTKEVTSYTVYEPAHHGYSLEKRSPERAPLSQVMASQIVVTRRILELLIRHSTHSQEHCAVINRFSKVKELEFNLQDLRLVQTETYATTKRILVTPRKDFQNTIVHSVLHLCFPELEGRCVQHSQYIFVDMLHIDVRSKYGGSHAMTTTDLSLLEITYSYPKARTTQEKYETYLIQKGKGIMKAFAVYNSTCTERNSQLKVLQLPEIRDEFRAAHFQYHGGQLDFEADSHALLILGMLSEMANPDFEVTDKDVPLDFVVKLPVNVTSMQRLAIIEQILRR
jgi:hypothetical protein